MKMIPLNILLAEDNDDHAELIQDALSFLNRDNIVQRVSHGAALVDLLVHQHGSTRNQESQIGLPDLILLDVKMPELNGISTLKKLKRHSTLQLPPVLMISTSSQGQDIEKSFQMGACGYILKPFSYDAFLSKLKSINLSWIID